MELGVQPNLMDVHHAFSATDLGIVLAGQVRYERYKPPEVSNDRWVEVLGADVNNLTHLTLTRGLTRDFAKQARTNQPDLLNTHEELVLEAAALIHDWAEAVVGDITYSDKTTEHENEEIRQLETILNQFSGSDYETTRDLIGQAAAEVVFNPDSKLGHIFNTIERVGYVRTALRASRHVLNNTAPDCAEGLRWIVADVFGNHITALLERVSDYAPVHSYLVNTRIDIANAFTVVAPRSFSYYEPDQQKPKEDAFHQAYVKFHIWRTSLPS